MEAFGLSLSVVLKGKFVFELSLGLALVGHIYVISRTLSFLIHQVHLHCTHLKNCRCVYGAQGGDLDWGWSGLQYGTVAAVPFYQISDHNSRFQSASAIYDSYSEETSSSPEISSHSLCKLMHVEAVPARAPKEIDRPT